MGNFYVWAQTGNAFSKSDFNLIPVRGKFFGGFLIFVQILIEQFRLKFKFWVTGLGGHSWWFESVLGSFSFSWSRDYIGERVEGLFKFIKIQL